jgi:predicted RNase H-like HicB family nuclease
MNVLLDVEIAPVADMAGRWHAVFEDMPDLVGDGASEVEAMENLRDKLHEQFNNRVLH